MKLLGIDYGTKRVGLAVTDPDGRLAFALKTLYTTTRDKLFAEILEVIATQGVQAVVLGLPSGLPRELASGRPDAPADSTSDSGVSGAEAPDPADALIARQIRNFATRLGRRTSLPIFFMDETLSSWQAEEDLRRAGLKGEKLRAVLDQQAAARILESFNASPQGRALHGR